MTRIKICGITNVPDALAAVNAGADFLGFVFASSPRQVDRRTVRSIVAELPRRIRTVGVFVDTPFDELTETLDECGLGTAQLQGAEPPHFAQAIGPSRCWKSFRIRTEIDLAPIAQYRNSVSMFHLDAYSPSQAGGTGKTFDWRLAVGSNRLGRSIVLSGGLTPENVCQAISLVQPDVVDVSSGVELSPGRKEADRLRSFVGAVREADRSIEQISAET